MNPDWSEYVMLEFDTYLVWGEVGGKRFEKRVMGDTELSALLRRHNAELKTLLSSIGREA